jgi:hypothetical protein
MGNDDLAPLVDSTSSFCFVSPLLILQAMDIGYGGSLMVEERRCGIEGRPREVVDREEEKQENKSHGALSFFSIHFDILSLPSLIHRITMI